MQKQEREVRLGEGGIVSFSTNATFYWLSVSIELQLQLVYLTLPLSKMQIASLSETEKIQKIMPLYGGNCSENKIVTSGNYIFFNSWQILLPRSYVQLLVVSEFLKKKLLWLINGQNTVSS